MIRPMRFPLPIVPILIFCELTILPIADGQARASPKRSPVTVTVVDENGVVVPDARVIVSQPGQASVEFDTNHAGRIGFALPNLVPYQLQVEKEGFYQGLMRNVDPQLEDIQFILEHEQIVRQEFNVVASTSTIDPQQTADVSTMSTPEVVNIPYQTSRDIRNLLPFNPGVIQDLSGQAHVAGSPTYATLDLLDGFDLRSPVSGTLSLHVSTDAVRSIDVESTRYPVFLAAWATTASALTRQTSSPPTVQTREFTSINSCRA
jgi:hypothetical protein